MGITVLSSTNLSIPGKSAGSQLPVDSGGADFAAFLAQQLSSPQLLDLQMTGMAIAQTEAEGKPPSDEENILASQDPSTASPVDGLLSAFMAAARPQEALNPALSSTSSEKARDPLAGIAGQLGLNAGKSSDQSQALAMEIQGDSATAMTGTPLRAETANIAVDSQLPAEHTQNFATTLAAQPGMIQQAQHRNEQRATAPLITTPLHDSHWPQDFGDKVVWLAKNDQQVAQLNINPPQLGPVQITLNLRGDQASAVFVSAHAEVRQAIQDAMPQLREALAGAGINLGQANVGTQLPQQHNGTPSQFSNPSRSEDDRAILRADGEQGMTTPLPSMRGGRGMVDLFA